MTAGEQLPDPGCADDAGEADPILLSALAAFEAGQTDAGVVERILLATRLLVPVVAVLGAGSDRAAPGDATLGHDKHVEMAMVTVTGRDGRRGLPVFTSVAAMQHWNPDARPVPVDARRAARAALDDGACALLVDPSPRPRFVVTEDRLVAIAAPPEV